VIPLTKPIVSFDEVADDLRRILASGRLTDGAYVRRFEAQLAEYVGTKHAVATTSATSALHLSLAAAGVGPGDEVLVSDFTFPASGNAIAQCGARPVCVDCHRGRFVLDLDEAESRITGRTRALMVVDPFGEPADLDRAAALAAAHGLRLLEDAACALGGHRAGRRCGSWPGAGCFSFHPRKIITTGEGGAITTDDDELVERLRLLRNHGGVPAEVGMSFVRHGFNYRMSEMQAALGSAQLARIDEFLAGRRVGADLYVELLGSVPGVTIPAAENPGATYQSFVVLLADDIERDAVARDLRAAGIEATLGTYAMHAQPAFAAYGSRPGDLPHAHRAQRQSLTLPLWPAMPSDLIGTVASQVIAAVEHAR
jgi:perosamine synthetase